MPRTRDESLVAAAAKLAARLEEASEEDILESGYVYFHLWRAFKAMSEPRLQKMAAEDNRTAKKIVW